MSRNDFNGAIDEKYCIAKEREKKRRIKLAPLRQYLKVGVEAGDDQRDGGTDRFRRNEPFNQRRDGGDPADRDRKDEYSRQSCDKDRIQRVQKPDRGAKFPIPPHFPALQAFTNRGFTVSAYAKARLYIHAEEPIGKCAQKLYAPQQETASEALLGEISVDFRNVKEQTGQEHKDASESSDCQRRVTAERKKVIG